MLKTTTLINIYKKLSTRERFILELISIIYEQTTQITINNCLYQFEEENNLKNYFAKISVRAILNKLQEANLLTDEISCHPDIVELITRETIANGHFKPIVKIVRQVLPSKISDKQLFNAKRCAREIRIAIYENDIETLNFYLNESPKQFPDFQTEFDCLVVICTNPFDKAWFQSLTLDLQALIVSQIDLRLLLRLNPCKGLLKLLRTYKSCQGVYGVYFRDALLNFLLLKLELKQAPELIKLNKNSSFGYAKDGCLQFILGNNDEALQQFEIATKITRKETKKRKVHLDMISNLFHLLALLKTNEARNFNQILEIIALLEKQNNTLLSEAFLSIKVIVLLKENKIKDAEKIINELSHQTSDAISTFFVIFANYWMSQELSEPDQGRLDKIFQRAKTNEINWLAFEIASLLIHADVASVAHTRFVTKISTEKELFSISSIIQQETDWERTLKALQSIGYRQELKARKTPARLAWYIDPQEKSIIPKEQKLNIDMPGTWTKGRNVSLKRLYEHDEELDFLTPQDLRTCNTIKRDSDYYGGANYSFDIEAALVELVGHPYLFLEGTNNIEIVLSEGEVALLVEEAEDGYTLKFPYDITNQNVLLLRETPTRYKIIHLTEIHRGIAATIKSDGLSIPSDAKAKLVKTIEHLSTMIPVHSDLDSKLQNIPHVEADTKPHLHILQYGNGFKIELFVRPFEDKGPYLKPGIGGTNIVSEIEGERIQARRNLKEETKRLSFIQNECPSIAQIKDINHDLVLDAPEDCLELLLELDEYRDDIVLEWPEGEKLKIRQKVDIKQASVSIKKQQDWFQLNGEVKLDEDNVINFKKLLELSKNKPSRFIEISDGQYLALTEAFRKRLDELHHYAEPTEDGLRLHSITGMLLDDLADQVGNFTADKAWLDKVKLMREASELVVEKPASLKAKLRDYQFEGYQWLSQLSHWGVGACLADDMGLGKTLQSLSLLLSRADKGPSLVIAPTSVCFNWLNEIAQFTPKLKPVSFLGKKRSNLLKNLKPFDIVISSYGLLQYDSELLTEVNWNTIVLDEAQSIKNTGTKRSQAAMKLQGDFKIITTGTPLENNLSEIWNLFQFINPGLLGSAERFNRIFVNGIEKYNNTSLRDNLKKLIQPFILRRLKSEVLKELPPRTEVTLYVEMEPDEAHFYEALRQKAIEEIKTLETPTKRSPIQILAEITKLRRAACHPKMITKDCGIESSKLQLVDETITELIDSNHKALVFSQFVEHLKIIKELLDERGINYKYLDGSTPQKERKKRVEEFQNGDGDIFLISLKAGGVGLNLTAADYVLILDPWWNPAVEDQASDRAHRMGQELPVTVYRFIVKNTIEEKILALHQSKRALADSLLEGTEMSAKLTADMLMQLISDSSGATVTND